MKTLPTYYINGKYLPKNKAFISVLDIGLLRGYGVFDFLVTYNNKPFLLDEHVQRLFNSAAEMGIQIGKSKKQIKNIIVKTLKKNLWKGEKAVRIVITGGVGENTTSPSIKPTIIVTVDPKYEYPAIFYSKGIKTITYNHIRSYANVKSLEYSTAIKALQLAKNQKAVEAIYVDKGTEIVSEATTSNLFLVINGKIYTSKENVLGGVTRDLVIKLLENTNPVIQKTILQKELFTADELFLTASNKEVMPVVTINNRKVGNGKVGDTTKEVMYLFKYYVQNGKR